jgi:hypothetical protein
MVPSRSITFYLVCLGIVQTLDIFSYVKAKVRLNHLYMSRKHLSKSKMRYAKGSFHQSREIFKFHYNLLG